MTDKGNDTSYYLINLGIPARQNICEVYNVKNAL